MNDLLTQLWPHASTAAAAKVREELEPMLALNKPRWMTDLSLHTFTLGDAAPHVAAIKVRGGPHFMSPLAQQIAHVTGIVLGRLAKCQLMQGCCLSPAEPTTAPSTIHDIAV